MLALRCSFTVSASLPQTRKLFAYSHVSTVLSMNSSRLHNEIFLCLTLQIIFRRTGKFSWSLDYLSMMLTTDMEEDELNLVMMTQHVEVAATVSCSSEDPPDSSF